MAPTVVLIKSWVVELNKDPIKPSHMPSSSSMITTCTVMWVQDLILLRRYQSCRLFFLRRHAVNGRNGLWLQSSLAPWLTNGMWTRHLVSYKPPLMIVLEFPCSRTPVFLTPLRVRAILIFGRLIIRTPPIITCMR